MVGVLEIEKRVENRCLVLKIVGEFTEHSCARFLNTLREGVVPGISRVILDIGDLTYMSTLGLSELAEVHQHLLAAGCELMLAGANARVRKLLLLSFLDKVIKTVDSVEAELASS